MKDEVAGLAKVALLSRHPARAELALCGPLNHPPAVPTKVGGRLSEGCIAIARHADGDGAAEPLEIARGSRWRCEHRPPVLTGTWDDAADERDEQEQVDRGEPRRSEHVEEAECLEDCSGGRGASDPFLHLERIVALLGQDRTGNARDRQEEEQDERGLHARELTPDPAEESEPPEGRQRCLRFRGRVSAHSAVSNPGIVTRSQMVNEVHAPVTRSRPITMSMAPPIRITHS